jgi:hypothetical protein
VENWIHPFVESLSDAIVETLSEGAHWIRKFSMFKNLKIKDIEFIQSTMAYYHDTQLQYDEPMKTLIRANQQLNDRMSQIKHASIIAF